MAGDWKEKSVVTNIYEVHHRGGVISFEDKKKAFDCLVALHALGIDIDLKHYEETVNIYQKP